MSKLSALFSALLVTACLANCNPLKARNISDLNYGPVPSESSYYSTYRGSAAPFPANITTPILPVANGPPGPDDILFQNLLAAEWAIYSFYQQGVETFNTSTFTTLGMPNTTYDRLQEIRDTEAGHMRIFQGSISNTSTKPGACAYDFGFNSDPIAYLGLQTLIEVSSMAFAAGLVQQARENVTKGALVGTGETETRHAVWALIDVWNSNPFAGPIDTSYPYPNQILDATNQFVIPESCPAANLVYPNPRQNLPQLSFNVSHSAGTPGTNITFYYVDPSHVPIFEDCKEYFAVFFHGLEVLSAPFDTKMNTSVIPAAFEKKGVIIAVIADQEGAPTEDSVVAGPTSLLQQPTILVGQL